MINDRVIHDILHADLVVADLTFSNANAFYELGIRHAAEKPVINFAQTGTELPFDTFGYRAIMEDITSWDGIERARQQIREQANATEAEGYRVSNPITQANASFKMRESADPQDHTIAVVLARLNHLERQASWGTERAAPYLARYLSSTADARCIGDFLRLVEAEISRRRTTAAADDDNSGDR